MSSLYEQEQKEVVDKLTNLRILDNREYLKSYSVAQRRTVLQLFFIVFITPCFSWVGVWIPETISKSAPMMISVIILALTWIFTALFCICYFLLFLIGARARIVAVFLSWVMNAYLITYILFNSTVLSSSNIKILEKFFTDFPLGNNINDFWYITGVTTFSLLISVVVSLYKINIFELEKLQKYSTLVSTVLALITYVINVSIANVNFAGQFLFFLLMEMLTSSSIISCKMKKMQEEADKIFRKELLRTHPVLYANLKRCYVFGGEAYKDKMLSNEKMYRIILRNESMVVCNAKRLKIIGSNPKLRFDKSASLKLRYPTVWIVKEESLKSFLKRKNRKPSV